MIRRRSRLEKVAAKSAVQNKSSLNQPTEKSADGTDTLLLLRGSTNSNSVKLMARADVQAPVVNDKTTQQKNASPSYRSQLERMYYMKCIAAF